jgi:hypothetical protein
LVLRRRRAFRGWLYSFRPGAAGLASRLPLAASKFDVMLLAAFVASECLQALD